MYGLLQNADSAELPQWHSFGWCPSFQWGKEEVEKEEEEEEEEEESPKEEKPRSAR